MAYLRLNISSLCNFSCKYCHVFKINKNKPQSKVMDYDIMDFSIKNYLDILKKHDENSLFISIYGGETLINKKNLFRIIEKYNNSYQDVSINWMVNTNGSLLTDEVADFFKKYNTDVHLSADGFEETHNKNRIDKFGKGTFGLVEKALFLIKQKGVKSQINSFVFPENVNRLFEIVDLAKKFSINRIYLDLFYDTQNRELSSSMISKKYFDVYEYGLKNSIFISGPWTRVFRKDIKRGYHNRMPSINITVDGKFFFNCCPTMKPLDLEHLNYGDFMNAYTQALHQFKELTYNNCGYCFLRKSCNGTMISQFQYHTGLETGWKNVCRSTREIIKLIKNRTEENRASNENKYISVLVKNEGKNAGQEVV